MTRCRKGLVITEALAAGISIVATLTLLPAVIRARHLARRTACTATLSGFAYAFPLYAADHRELYPDLGSDKKDLTADPTPADRLDGLYKTKDSNLQTYALLVYAGTLSNGQFACPADKAYVRPNHGKKYGFDTWHSSSYAEQPTSSAYKASLARNLEGGVIIMGDRPLKGKLEGKNANHRDGGNFLNYNGSVTFERGTDIGVDDDEVYLLGDIDDATDSYLIWGKDNLEEKPDAKKAEAGKAGGA